MVWDAYKCHVSEAVKAECRRMKLEMAVVPGGCTKFVQAADVVWNIDLVRLYSTFTLVSSIMSQVHKRW